MDLSRYKGEFEKCPDKPEISLETLTKFNVTHLLNEDGDIIGRSYPYYNNKNILSSYKIRYLPKDFRTMGDGQSTSLFGSNVFSTNNKLFITVTEGEDDTLAAFQMLGGKYPCVSVRSSSTAVKDISSSLEYLLSFSLIYLCFDNDGPGREATKKVCELLPL